MTENNQAAASEDDQDVGHVGVGAYVALIITILFFSGLFYNIDGYKWLGSFDFTTLAGGFGKIDGLTYIGKGGFGARQGFLFALSLFPSVMLALGVMEVVTYYGAMRAAQKLMTPLLNPILGVPGSTGLALITDLQSTDAGAALTKGMYDRGLFDKKGLIVGLRLAVFRRRSDRQLFCFGFRAFRCDALPAHRAAHPHDCAQVRRRLPRPLRPQYGLPQGLRK